MITATLELAIAPHLSQLSAAQAAGLMRSSFAECSRIIVADASLEPIQSAFAPDAFTIGAHLLISA